MEDPGAATTRPSRVGFGDVLRVRAFLVLYVAETQSIVGDQLARIALSVLVFDLTGSVAATALTYAATFAPAILGGALLAGIGDSLPRRTVMVGCDLIRAAAFGAMAIPDAPIAVVISLLVVAVFIGPAFSASEVSYLARELDEDQFRAGTGLRLITNQFAQVGGFAIGGLLVGLLTPAGALAVDAASFAGSAVVIFLGLPSERLKPGTTASASLMDAAVRNTTERGGREHANRRFLWDDRRLRGLIGTCWLAGFFVVPEGLAVPVGHLSGASTLEIGYLLAAIPLGASVGALTLVRWVPQARRETTAGWMAVLAGLPLIATAWTPHWPVILVAWAVSGALAAYQVEVTTLIVQTIPDISRARLLGVVSAGLVGSQGVGLIVFGGLAQLTGAGVAVAGAGAAGVAIGSGIRLRWWTPRPVGRASGVAPSVKP